VQLTDSIRANTQSERKRCHIKGATILLGAHCKFQNVLQRHATGIGFTRAVTERSNNASHQVNAELLIAG